MATDLESYLEVAGAKPSSNTEWVMDCPFCGKPGHMYINAEPAEGYDGRELPPGRFICFRCGERSMSFARLMAELDGTTFEQARASVNKWKIGNVAWRREAFRVNQATKINTAVHSPDSAEWLPPEFEPVWNGEKWLWPKYLTRRGVNRDLAMKMGLGVCRRGEYRARVILPVICPAGRSFTARSIHADEDLRYKSGPDAGQLLFGWETIEDAQEAVLVEGPFDALRVIQAGLPCVAMLGKRLRNNQLAMLKTPPRRQMIVMLDPDALGDAAEIAGQLGGHVAVGLTSDPGDSSVEEIRAAFHRAIDPAAATNLSTRNALDRNREARG